MIKVYFESKSHADHVADVYSEKIYARLIKMFELIAKEANMIVTESVEDVPPMTTVKTTTALAVIRKQNLSKGVVND